MICLNQDNRDLAIEAASFYLIAYTATTIAAFGLLTLISARQVERENVALHHISGLFWRQPLLAALILGSGIGIYYYLRVVYYMTRRPEPHHVSPDQDQRWHQHALSCALIATILLLGTLPQPLLLYLASIL